MSFQNVKRALLFWILVIVILFSIESFIRIGIRNSTYSYYYKVNLICNGKVKPQVAVFGSSVGEVGINTPLLSKELHKSVYNFSIDGTRFLQYNGLVKQHIVGNDSLQWVIFAETILNLEKNSAVTGMDRYVAYINNPSIYESLMDVQPELAFKVRYIPFYKFIIMEHPYYKASILGWLRKFKGNELSDPELGFTPKVSEWQRDIDELNKNTAPYTLTVDSSIMIKYKNIVNVLTDEKIKVLVVFMPIQMDGQKLILNIDEYRKAYTSLSNQSVLFYDLTTDTMCSDKKYFYNNSHVNSTGANLVSEKIIEFFNKVNL